MTATPRNYTFLHITEPDGAGHAGGWISAGYNTSIATTDSRLGQVFAMIDSNPTLNGHTAVIVTADHGGGVPANNHNVPTELVNYTIPYFVWGAGLPQGSNLYNALANCFDPGTGRPTYIDPLQPLWDGDSGNMALALLGLGPIPGSSLRPAFHTVPEPSSAVLAAIALAFGIAFARRRSRRTWQRRASENIPERSGSAGR